MDTDLKRFEEELERLSPGSLPEGLIARMEAAMEGWEEGAVEGNGTDDEERDKVVPFPGQEPGGSRRRSESSHWAAAAAVALLGAVVGLLMTASPEKVNNPKPGASTVPLWTDGLQPVDFSAQTAKRKLLGASEQSVMIANGAQPLRVMRFDYVDRVVFRNAQGEEVHVEVPTVNFRLIPVVTD